MKKVEVLAPAGNLESFYVAVNNGADAVYLGIDEFNARGNIENFRLDNIGQVIDYAHIFGVKIYLTLNILFSDKEITKVIFLVENLLKLGVDAFIIQDFGLANVLKKTFPNIILHASTQMGICNLEGAEFVKNLGFSRVVLARETPLEEIKRIHDNCDIEIEYFVQGALCVAYSGNCYFSSLQSGASGNRGKCKQFCRLPYRLTDGSIEKEGYLLSAKDFCMLDRLQDLKNAGVCSFKIEGRARRAGYVGQVVDIYRKAVDGNNDKNDMKSQLKTAFNRGNYIEGYFNDDKKIYPQIQGHSGLEIGKVIKFERGKRFNIITIKTNHKLCRGDGLKFILNDREIASIGVNDVRNISKDIYQITSTSIVKEFSKVCLTLDSLKEYELLEKKRKISIEASFYAEIDKKAILKLQKDDIYIELESNEVLNKAQNQPLTQQEVERQLSKANDIFDIEFKDVKIDVVFMRKADLNQLRREAIEALKKKIIELYRKENLKELIKNDYNFSCHNFKVEDSELILFSCLEQLKNEKIVKTTKLIYCPSNYLFDDIKSICQRFQDFEIYLSLPIFVTQRDLLFLTKIFEANANLNIYANNYYALNFVKGRKIIASNNLNVYNSQTIKFLKASGVDDIVLSVEQDAKFYNSGARLYTLENYKPVLMTLLHCPFKEHFNSVCRNCKYRDGMQFIMQSGKKLDLKRKKIISCTFELIADHELKFNENYLKAKVLF